MRVTFQQTPPLRYRYTNCMDIVLASNLCSGMINICRWVDDRIIATLVMICSDDIHTIDYRYDWLIPSHHSTITIYIPPSSWACPQMDIVDLRSCYHHRQCQHHPLVLHHVTRTILLPSSSDLISHLSSYHHIRRRQLSIDHRCHQSVIPSGWCVTACPLLSAYWLPFIVWCLAPIFLCIN